MAVHSFHTTFTHTTHSTTHCLMSVDFWTTYRKMTRICVKLVATSHFLRTLLCLIGIGVFVKSYNRLILFSVMSFLQTTKSAIFLENWPCKCSGSVRMMNQNQRRGLNELWFCMLHIIWRSLCAVLPQKQATLICYLVVSYSANTAMMKWHG